MGFFSRGERVDESAVDASINERSTREPSGSGPWDSDGPVPEGKYLDFGGLRLPTIPGLKIHVDTKENRVVLIRVEAGSSQMQLAPFAAPRTEGIWDEIREEIADQITTDGGIVDEFDGRFGRELLAKVVVRSEGKTGRRTVRFIGADGPRWFLRGVITGTATTDPQAAALLEDVFSGCVVVRGSQAMPVRDLLPMNLPNRAPVGEPVPAADTFDPLTRGPEITETR